jgi:hypothetical protein
MNDPVPSCSGSNLGARPKRSGAFTSNAAQASSAMSTNSDEDDNKDFGDDDEDDDDFEGMEQDQYEEDVSLPVNM